MWQAHIKAYHLQSQFLVSLVQCLNQLGLDLKMVTEMEEVLEDIPMPVENLESGPGDCSIVVE